MHIEKEYAFTLPHGYIDGHGTLHQAGVMRLATAADEIAPLRDLRVKQNPAYLTILILSRVIIRLGTMIHVDEALIEKLSAQDLAYLEMFYQAINAPQEQ